jgi:hypothetical protein
MTRLPIDPMERRQGGTSSFDARARAKFTARTA